MAAVPIMALGPGWAKAVRQHAAPGSVCCLEGLSADSHAPRPQLWPVVERAGLEARSASDIPGARGWYTEGGKPYRYVDDRDRDKMADEISADWAVDVLKKKHDRPFYLAVGFMRPHTPLYVPKRYFDLFPLEKIQLPPYQQDDLADCAAVLRGRWPWGFQKYRALVQAGGETAWKEWVQAYLACMAFADEQAGPVLDALAASPYRDNTIVVLTSDNGYHVGEKDCIQKWHLWENPREFRFSFVRPGPCRTAGSRASGVLDRRLPDPGRLVRLPAQPNSGGSKMPLEGHSLRPLLEDPERGRWGGPSTAFMAIRDGQQAPHFSVRSQRYRYTLCANGDKELYDHDHDPHEWETSQGSRNMRKPRGNSSRS